MLDMALQILGTLSLFIRNIINNPNPLNLECLMVAMVADTIGTGDIGVTVGVLIIDGDIITNALHA